MTTKLRSVTVKFHPAMFAQIQVIAEKRGETISDTIRHLIGRGLCERIYEENTDLIARIVKTQVEQVIRSYVVLPNLDNIEHPDNLFSERVVLYRNTNSTGMNSIRVDLNKVCN